MPNRSATTVIIIRHGERDDSNPADPDPHLNKAGKARAQTLIHVLGKSGTMAIYTSHFIRTKETAQPLAMHLNLSPIQMDEASNIRDDILSKQVGKTVLVIGHTDSIPDLIEQLGGESHFKVEDKDFDALFVVTVFNSNRVNVTELRYGSPS